MRADALVTPPRPDKPLSDTHLYAGLFTTAAASFCLAQLIGHRLGLASDLIAIVGDATCGWSWLFVRALFQPPKAQRAVWPMMLVMILVVTGAFLRLTVDGSEAAPRLVQNLSTLVSSALLLLAAIEPLKRLGPGIQTGERIFRIGFATGYMAILAVAVIWVDGAPTGGWLERSSPAIKAGCAIIAVVGMVYAVWYRGHHPLVAIDRPRRRPQTSAIAGLGERLLRLMQDEAIYTRPSLKVADLARILGEAEYKVTQSITGPLGFRNFNHMANHFRVEEAKRRLVDPAHNALPVLSIAYDCGFGSIGPFNRAFKAQTGLPPAEFRKHARLAAVPSTTRPRSRPDTRTAPAPRRCAETPPFRP